jgi:hypothetical protein
MSASSALRLYWVCICRGRRGTRRDPACFLGQLFRGFLSAPCPTQIFTPTLPWPVQNCRDGTGTCTARRGFGCSKLRDGPSLSITSTCHCNELGNGKQGGEHLPRPALRFCSLLHTALIRN